MPGCSSRRRSLRSSDAVLSTLALLYRSPRPLVNSTLIGLNVLAFLYLLTLDGLETVQATYRFGVIPVELTSGRSIELLSVTGIRNVALDISPPPSPWGSIFTSMFMHGGWMHIVGNMLFLWGFGDKVERKLGHIKYVLFYLLAGTAAAWTQVAIDTDSRAPMIGASGAIFGVLGAYLLAYPYERALPLLFVFFLMPIFFSVGSLGPVDPGTGIAYMAHVGGFAAGVLLMAGYKYLLKEPILPQRPLRPWGH